MHVSALLPPGGRLGMVVPFEIGHAAYALPVIAYLQRTFASVTFLTVRTRLFPQLSQDAMLLLAEGKGQGPTAFRWQGLESSEDLATLDPALPQAVKLDAARLAAGEGRLIEAFLPPAARGLYTRLVGHGATRRLGQLADVGIGYVTGANEFFHLTRAEAQSEGIEERFLRPAVRRGRSLKGVKFTGEDWQNLLDQGEAGYLTCWSWGRARRSARQCSGT